MSHIARHLKGLIMDRSNKFARKIILIIANAMMLVGVYCLISPFIWSMKASYYQHQEVVNWYKPVPAASYAGTRPVMPKAGIAISKLRLDAVIVEERVKSDLNRGPMHLAGTGLPGRPGNCCIAAHKEKWFRGLWDLKPGDKVAIYTWTRRYVYTITGKKIVKYTDLSVLRRTRKPTITLITCTGPQYFGRGKGRWIITGVLSANKPNRHK